MIDSFDILFFKLLLKNSTVKWIKDIFLGILFSLLFILFFIISSKYLKLTCISFALLTSFASFLKSNEIFMVYEDFKILNLKINSMRFYKSYIIQRFFYDNYITNITTIILIIAFLSITDWKNSVWIVLLLLTYILTMPINHVLGIKCSKIIITKVILDTILVVILVLGAINNWSFVNIILNEPSNVFSLGVFFLILLFLSFGLFILSKSSMKSLNFFNLQNTYKLLTFIKKINIELYKDYLLNFQHIVISIISVIILFFIIKDFNNTKSIAMTFIFVIAPTGLFNVKKNKQYELITKDCFFCNKNISKKDLLYIKFSKLKTILSETIIKLIISIIILIMCKDVKDIHILIDISIISIISSLIHFMMIIRNDRITSVYMYIIKYTLIVIGLLNVQKNINTSIYWSYMIVVGLLTIFMTKEILNEDGVFYEKNV